MIADIAIIGAGMAGASLAAELAPHARVLLIEGEARPGYHSTGRSAAFWSESYGGPCVRPLTTASRAGLADYLAPRGAIHLARAGEEGALAALERDFAGQGLFTRCDRGALAAVLPGLRPGWNEGLAEPSTADIDVARYHDDCLRRALSHGARLVCDAPIARVERSAGRWRLDAACASFEAHLLVDAAGAWADRMAALAGAAPLGIRPYRRTIVQARLEEPVPAGLPLVLDAAGSFYLKPLADGRIWLSPHDETACDPCDAAAEELDVALAIDRMEQAFDWRVTRVEHRWAGLRSFAPDRLPVYGFDRSMPGFFWCAGQGGFGIQTAPAAAALAARLLLGQGPGAVDPAPFAPARFAG